MWLEVRDNIKFCKYEKIKSYFYNFIRMKKNIFKFCRNGNKKSNLLLASDFTNKGYLNC